MKNALLTCCVLPFLLAPATHAGINGIYKVRGTESQNGEKSFFTGTVIVSNYNKGKYALKFNDGGNAPFTFTFSKKLKDMVPIQTVSASSSQGTASATFKIADGKYQLNFTYKAKGEDIRGAGTGSKKL